MDDHFRGTVMRVLRLVVPDLERRGLPWALVGSSASCLQGLPCVPKDIDLASNREGAYLMGQALAPFTVRPIAFSETERYASHFGIFSMDGVNVEVMGDLLIRGENEHIDLAEHYVRWNREVRHVHVEELEVPVSPLEWQLIANTLLDRHDRAGDIAAHLRAYGFDRPFLEEILTDPHLSPRTVDRVWRDLGLGGEP
jgi:hypothetical protein